MRILFYRCVPRTLRRFFVDHSVETTAQNNWQELSNGNLLDAAQVAAFDVFLTVDQNLQHQQNLAGRRLYLLILVAENSLVTTLAPLVPLALNALQEMQPGDLRQIVPLQAKPKRLPEDQLAVIAQEAIHYALLGFAIPDSIRQNVALEVGGTGDERTFHLVVPAESHWNTVRIATASVNRYSGCVRRGTPETGMSRRNVEVTTNREPETLPLDQLLLAVTDMEKEMKTAARALDFETATQLRDEIGRLKKLLPASAKK